jgi:hypothetical protein
MAKIKKATKPSQRDKEIKAKRTGYRFKTEGNPKLHKKDGSLNKKGEELYYKKPTTDEIEKYKKTNNKYPDADGLKQIYHERRANRKHSDDNLKTKFGKGGGVTDVTKNILKEYVFEYKYPKHKNKPSFNQYYSIDTSKVVPIGGMSEDGFKLKFINGNESGAAITVTKALQAIRNGEIELEQSEGYFVKIKAIKKDSFAKGGRVYKKGLAYKLERAKHNKSEDWEVPMSKRKQRYDNGGGVGRIKVGTFDETQLKNKEDKKAIEKAQKETGLKYIDSKIIKKGGKMFMEVYLIPTDEYLKSSKFDKGGDVKQNKPQSKSYSKEADKLEKAKPVGMRYTDKLAKKLGKRVREEPTKKDVEKYLGKGVYDEKRKDKSDASISNKFEEGGETEKNIELSVDEMKASLGREPKYPYDFIAGKKYVKCFLRPYYKLVD